MVKRGGQLEFEGQLVETRISKITSNLFSADTIDTQVMDAVNILKGTIHSEITGNFGDNDVDTLVKDAAGHSLRQLRSEYHGNLLAADRICTHVK